MNGPDHNEKDIYDELTELRDRVAGLNAEAADHERLLDQLRHRLRFEEIVLDVSMHFIDLAPEEVNDGIRHALEAVGSFVGADCAHVVQFKDAGTLLDVSHSWNSGPAKSHQHSQFSTERFLWCMQRIQSGTSFQVPEITGLPAEASAEKEFLLTEGVKSCLVAPILWSRTLVGFLIFAAMRDERTWPRHVVSSLNSVGEIIANVLEHKRMDSALRAASRMDATARLAGGLAHEFNNLMVAVVGNAELLHKSLTDQPDTKRTLRDIMNAGRRASELCRQMVAFARGGKYQSVQIDLNEIVRRVVSLRQQSGEAQAKCECELDPNLPPITADPSQMSRVVDSLYDNAVEASETGGQITVSTRMVQVGELFAESHPGLKPGEHVCLTVKDKGCGMDGETLKRVFEPFFSTRFQGRGLGLSATYGIVKNHHGHIAISSRPGRGTVVDVYLPAAAGKAAAIAPAGKDVDPARPTETVLLVDDDKLVIETTGMMLEHLGYGTISACNGKEAVDIARGFEGDIHAVLLDMAMPEMNGAEAFPLLRAALPETKIIICSGYELDAVSQKLLDDGASDFLQKPFQMDDLGGMLRRVLNS